MAAAAVAAPLLLASSCSEAANHGIEVELLSQITRKLKATIDRGQSFGVLTLVARNGEIASIDAVGWRFMDKDLTSSTLLNTAAATMPPK